MQIHAHQGHSGAIVAQVVDFTREEAIPLAPIPTIHGDDDLRAFLMAALNTRPDAKLCPPHLREGLDQYAENGRPTGDFLRAVLEHDLKAIDLADDLSLAALHHVRAYVYNCLPMSCHGSPDAVHAHLQRFAQLREAASQSSTESNNQ